MTLQIPQEFPDWLVNSVLGYFPKGDEDACRRLGDSWSDTSNTCTELAHRHDTVAQAEKAAAEGVTGEAKAGRNSQLGDDLRNQAAYADNMAQQLYENANNIEFTKLLIIGTGFALLAQLAVDVALLAPGALKAAEDKAAADTTMRIGRNELLNKIKGAGAQAMAHRKGIPLAKVTAIGVAIGAGTNAIVNAGAQFYQEMVLGHGDGDIEWDQVGDAAIVGGIAGGVGVRVASRFAPRINNAVSKVFRNPTSNGARYGAQVSAGLLIGGVGGVAGGVAGVGAQMVVSGHIPSEQEIKGALITGIAGGFVGAASVFARPVLPHAPAKTPTSESSDGGTNGSPDGETNGSPNDGQPGDSSPSSPEGAGTTRSPDEPTPGTKAGGDEEGTSSVARKEESQPGEDGTSSGPRQEVTPQHPDATPPRVDAPATSRADEATRLRDAMTRLRDDTAARLHDALAQPGHDAAARLRDVVTQPGEDAAARPRVDAPTTSRADEATRLRDAMTRLRDDTAARLHDALAQ
ncbi:hypothetical protein AB0H00_10080, partial [Nocardia sp. NPDC023852]|uniref:WXG100-like domain-containing protein n=1 Tax=Nocardia sp. NPDC023852 TaxID=3154697 RepID=UPI0033C16DFC